MSVFFVVEERCMCFVQTHGNMNGPSDVYFTLKLIIIYILHFVKRGILYSLLHIYIYITYTK